MLITRLHKVDKKNYVNYNPGNAFNFSQRKAYLILTFSNIMYVLCLKWIPVG